MFVPRALRLKGVKETQKRKPNQPTGSDVTEASNEDALVQAMQNASTNSAAPSPAAQSEEHLNETKASKKPKTTTTTTSSEYLAQLVAGIELIFTDYAHQDKEGAKWLEERYRTVDGEEKFIHLTAILEHPNISTLKPQATQPLLRQALQDIPSSTLDISPSGFYIRRRPSTYPAPFVPPNSFSVVDDEGLSFWDQRTIYVEPHIRHLCKTPAKVAHWLKEHGQLRTKWLPVQAVHTLYNSCAFVVLSGSVMHEDQWGKWRAAGKPEDWKVMTKVENLRRTEEYEKLVRGSRVEAGKQRQGSRGEDGQGDVRDALSAGAAGDDEQAASKKKKRKRGKSAAGAAHDEADTEAGEVASSGDGERSIKRRA
ncbi:hypothetical protein P171DRAFT_483328 [Karstenula rhodostoma CBS 690.94]|uniref:Uncharacterized protein n=1 Tax=Karstenula rhodostoma CBS 690.94 TaxID=1392251 RepID=A0A9P4PNL6_9PLEO|nr:hypothetical protein P171DRAFT_483328 [Karstenula rhodostoma CBS 690.94]